MSWPGTKFDVMKIIRTYDETGTVVHAAWLSAETAEVLDGFPESPQPTGRRIPINRLLPPVVPPVIVAIAQNYRAHAMEMGGKMPPHPVLFIKMPGTLC